MIQFVDQIISKKGFVDLHIHTNDSYGEEMDAMDLTPEELLECCYLYSQKNNNAPVTFAITDHNSIDGVQKVDLLIKSAPEKYKNIHFISGCEFTCSAGSLGTFINGNGHIKNIVKNFHMLAYGFNPLDEDINFLTKLHSTRRDNSVYCDSCKMLEKVKVKISAGAYVLAIKTIMKDYGYDVPIKDFKDVNLKTRNLDENTYINYLMNYIKKFNLPKQVETDIERQLRSRNIIHLGRLDCMEVMEIVENAGGYCVLAHPFLLCMAESLKSNNKNAKTIFENLLKTNGISFVKDEALDKMLIRYVTYMLKNKAHYKFLEKKLNGIVGMEVLHQTSTHDKKRLNTLIEIAEKNNLYMTGGSDSHGTFLKDSILSQFMSKAVVDDRKKNNVVMENNLFASLVYKNKLKESLTCDKDFDNQITIIKTIDNKEIELNKNELATLLKVKPENYEKTDDKETIKRDKNKEFNDKLKKIKTLEQVVRNAIKDMQNLITEMKNLVELDLSDEMVIDNFKSLKPKRKNIKLTLKLIEHNDSMLRSSGAVKYLEKLINDYNNINQELKDKYYFIISNDFYLTKKIKSVELNNTDTK